MGTRHACIGCRYPSCHNQMSADPQVRSREIDVCDVADLRGGQIQSVMVGPTRLAAVMTGSAVKVFFASCPHQGAPLEKGRIVAEVVSDRPGELTLLPESQLLRCPWHGYEFELQGGRAVTDRDMCLRFVPSTVAEGKVRVLWPPGP
jgi:nitrite reductase/ring-hydroxylating ferredoxin subunit